MGSGELTATWSVLMKKLLCLQGENGGGGGSRILGVVTGDAAPGNLGFV